MIKPETLSSFSATCRYLKHMLSEPRPAEIDAVQSYLNRIKPIFEEAASRNSCLIEWNKPVIYVQEIFKRLPTISTYAQFSRGHHVQSDTTQEFTVYDGRTRTEKTGLLFVENSFRGHSLTGRIIPQTGEFATEGLGSLDYLMKDRQWAAHEAIVKKAALKLLGQKPAVKSTSRQTLREAA